MNAAPKPATPEGLALLRAPFLPNQISKLPKGNVMLDYVGHAALTDRLLDADPLWDWEPLAIDARGLPAIDEVGGLWIKLTVCGKTRLGYGHAGAKKGGDAVKEIIGDAMRNAAMRFGAALDLWHKGDLHLDDEADAKGGGDAGGGQSNGAQSAPASDHLTTEPASAKGRREPAHSALKTKLREWGHEFEGVGDWDVWCAFRDSKETVELLAEMREKLPDWWEGGPEQPEEFVSYRRRIEVKEYELANQIADIARA